MRFQQFRYSYLAFLIALVFWFSDSSVHHFLYKEATFELIPESFNELWMRVTIVALVLGFGIYVDISVHRIKKLYQERQQLQLQRDKALTRLLGGFLSICSVCKKVRPKVPGMDTDQAWENIDSYISKHSEVEFSHGYCPECGARAMEDARTTDA